MDDLKKDYLIAGRGLTAMILLLAFIVGLCFASAVGVGCGISTLAEKLGVEGGKPGMASGFMGYISGLVTLVATIALSAFHLKTLWNY